MNSFCVMAQMRRSINYFFLGFAFAGVMRSPCTTKSTTNSRACLISAGEEKSMAGINVLYKEGSDRYNAQEKIACDTWMIGSGFARNKPAVCNRTRTGENSSTSSKSRCVRIFEKVCQPSAISQL